MSNIYSDPALNFVFWIGAGSMVLTGVLASTIILLRIRARLQERRENIFVAKWHPLLMHILAGETVAKLPPVPRGDQSLFLKHWNHFQESLRGNAPIRLNEAAYRWGIDNIARRLLRRGNQTEQLLAILTLGHLRDRAAWNDLVTVTNSPNSTLSIYAARALIQIHTKKAALHVMSLLLQREDWDIMRAAQLLQESRGVLGQVLVHNLANLPIEPLLRGLKLAEVLHLQIPTAAQLYLLRPDAPLDVLMAALRIATGSEVLDTIRAYVTHADWRVRVQVAHALGRIGEASDIARLTGLLQDPQWWVRYRAAQSLVGLPFLSATELARMHTDLPDRYARDILGQVLAERNPSQLSAR